MSRKFKAIFTKVETVQFTRLFDAGLDSVSKEKTGAIRDAAKKLEQEIKVCMYVLGLSDYHDSIHYRDSLRLFMNKIVDYPSI